MNAHAQDPRIDDVLTYWLGAARPSNGQALERKNLWFIKSDATDADIRARFGPLVDEALAGRLDGWAATARGRLALIVLLDQFTRNLFRATPRSFAGDDRALQLALDGMDQGHDRDTDIPAVARIFCYLPLEHAEDLALQNRSVAAFQALADEAAAAAPAVREFLAGTLDYARRHHEVIARYGRFPHRNPILDRQSTPAETLYLAQPGAGF
ncbi:MAG: DUF924 domain-containing protein [Burkholderiaceae bacterium]|jgi:uncharacterized protein (DUF924 family)|nr:DUF924 domain-containing protein [Burkholderiaceae bacterium]